MNWQYVLSENDKKLRFRKLNHRKKEEHRKHLQANPHLLRAMPPLERIRPAEQSNHLIQPALPEVPVPQNAPLFPPLRPFHHPQSVKPLSPDYIPAPTAPQDRFATDITEYMTWKRRANWFAETVLIEQEKQRLAIQEKLNPDFSEFRSRVSSFQNVEDHRNSLLVKWAINNGATEVEKTCTDNNAQDTAENADKTAQDTPENEDKSYVHKKFRPTAEFPDTEIQILENR